MNPVNKQKEWQVYIIEASDSKLYTGITTDIQNRWLLHTSGKGAKFFRGRLPKRICYLEEGHSKSSASKREAEIKKLSREQKIMLVNSLPFENIRFLQGNSC